MGKFFQRTTGQVGCCVTSDDETRYLPADATATAAFDETVPANATLVSEFHSNPSRFTFVGGQLRRDGVAVSFTPDSTERANYLAFRAEASQALADNQAFIDLASPSNAQNAAQIKALTRQMNRVIRLFLRLVTRGIL